MRKETKDLLSQRLAFIEACVDQCGDAKGLTRSTVWNLLQMDLVRIRCGNYANAVSSLCQLIRETQAPAAYMLLAEARSRMGQKDLAMVTLDVLGYVDPGFAEARLMRGLILCEQGAVTEAREALQSVFRVKPSVPVAWQTLIDIALDQGGSGEAARRVNEALQHPPIHHDAANALIAAGGGNP